MLLKSLQWAREGTAGDRTFQGTVCVECSAEGFLEKRDDAIWGEAEVDNSGHTYISRHKSSAYVQLEGRMGARLAGHAILIINQRASVASKFQLISGVGNTPNKPM